MQFASQSVAPDRRQSSPTISAALTDSLFEAPGTVLTGIVDAVSILALGRVFVANMTGNVVFVGFALVGASGFSPPAITTRARPFRRTAAC